MRHLLIALLMLLSLGSSPASVPNDVPVEIWSSSLPIQEDCQASIIQPEIVPEIEWVDCGIMQITTYGPHDRPPFTLTSRVARYIGRHGEQGLSVGDAIDWATDLGCDGICAASKGPSGLYNMIRKIPPVIVQVEGHGKYLLVDRTTDNTNICWNTIDIWSANDGFCEKRQVRRSK